MMSMPLEKLISELNSVSPVQQEKIINSVPWIKQKLIRLIESDLINLDAKNVFDEITKTRELLYTKYGEMPDCTKFIREDRQR